MGKIDIKGYIVSNDDREFYDFYGMTCTYPKMVQDAITNDEDEEITLQTAVMCSQLVKSILCFETVASVL